MSTTNQDILKKQLIQAMIKTMGIVTTACKLVESDPTKAENLRKKHYSWMKKDPKYAEEITSIEDIAIDFAESKLQKQIENHDTTATIFFLKTKGKRRGYVEKIEHENKNIHSFEGDPFAKIRENNQINEETDDKTKEGA